MCLKYRFEITVIIEFQSKIRLRNKFKLKSGRTKLALLPQNWINIYL